MTSAVTKKDITQVVRIHQQELSGFLSDLGDDFLKKFYQTSLDIPEMHTIVEKENEQIIGFVTYATSVKGLYFRVVCKDILGFAWLFLKYFVTHIDKVIKVFQAFTYPGFREDIPELLTIVVDRNYQRRGIGRRLFAQVAKEIAKKGYREFKISTYERLPANGFYKKIGCKFDRSFHFLGEKMNYYLYQTPLSPDSRKK